MVSCGIAWRIAFRFHNSPANPPIRQFANHDLSDQKPRKFQCVARKFFSRYPAEFEGRAFHGYGELTSGGSLLKSRASSAWSITTAGSV